MHLAEQFQNTSTRREGDLSYILLMEAAYTTPEDPIFKKHLLQVVSLDESRSRMSRCMIRS